MSKAKDNQEKEVELLNYFILNDEPFPPGLLDKYDFVNTKQYAIRIIEIIKHHINLQKKCNNNNYFTNSLNLAIYGPWGCGKTTILKELKAKSENDYKICYFCPWKYENTPLSITFALLRQIESKSGLNITERNQTVTAISDFWLQYLGGSVFDLNEAKKLRESFNDSKSEDYSKWIDPVENFSEMFNTFVKRITTDKPLLVLIDDLDRCTPDNALELLQNIKNYLNVDNCIFVMAIDKEVLAKYITKKYDIDCFNGYKFLEKIFQYEISLLVENVSLSNALKKYAPLLNIDDKEMLKTLEKAFGEIHLPYRNFKRILKRYLFTTNNKNIDKPLLFLKTLIAFELLPAFELEFNKLTTHNKALFIKTANSDSFRTKIETFSSRNSEAPKLSYGWGCVDHLLNCIANNTKDIVLIEFITNLFTQIQKEYSNEISSIETTTVSKSAIPNFSNFLDSLNLLNSSINLQDIKKEQAIETTEKEN